MSEQTMQKLIFKYLRKQYKFVEQEVPALSRCIDLIYADNESQIISIEVKLTNWKKAIEQAKEHQIVADKSYICLPKKKKGVSGALISYLNGTGIGLYVFSTSKKGINIEVVQEAQKRSDFWLPSRIKIENTLYGKKV